VPVRYVLAVVSRSNTAGVTRSAYCTSAVTALCDDANSDISSHQNVMQKETANNGSRITD
jgi:hypothetical protein